MTNELNLYWMIFHLSQVIVFQFYAAPRLSHLSYKVIYNRNPDLAKTLLSGKSHLHPPMWDYLLAVVSISLIVYGYTQSDANIYLVGKYISILGLLLTCLIIDSYKSRIYKEKLPLIVKRSATLVPREIGSSVPIWGWVVYILVSSILIFLLGSSIVSKLVSLSVVAFFLAAAYRTDKRAKVFNDLEDDSLFRINESWTIFFVAWSFPLALMVKQFAGYNMVSAISSSAPLILFLFFLNSSVYKRIIK